MAPQTNEVVVVTHELIDRTFAEEALKKGLEKVDKKVVVSARQHWSGLGMTPDRLRLAIGASQANTRNGIHKTPTQASYQFSGPKEITVYREIHEVPFRPKQLDVFCTVEDVRTDEKLKIETLITEVGPAQAVALGSTLHQCSSESRETMIVELAWYGSKQPLEPFDAQRKTPQQHQTNIEGKERSVVASLFDRHTINMGQALVNAPPQYTEGFLEDPLQTASAMQEAVCFPVASDGTNVSLVGISGGPELGNAANKMKNFMTILSKAAKKRGLGGAKGGTTVVATLPEAAFLLDAYGRNPFKESQSLYVWSGNQQWLSVRSNADGTAIVTNDVDNGFADLIASQIDTDAHEGCARTTACFAECAPPLSLTSHNGEIAVYPRGFDDANAPGGDGVVAPVLQELHLSKIADSMAVFGEKEDDSAQRRVETSPALMHSMHRSGVKLLPCEDYIEHNPNNSGDATPMRLDPFVSAECVGVLDGMDHIDTSNRHFGGVSTTDCTVEDFEKSANTLYARIMSFLTDAEKKTWEDGTALVTRNAECGGTDSSHELSRAFIVAQMTGTANALKTRLGSSALGVKSVPDIDVGQEAFTSETSVFFPGHTTVELLEKLGDLPRIAGFGASRWAKPGVKEACATAKAFVALLRKVARYLRKFGGDDNLIASGAAAPAGLAVDSVWTASGGLKKNAPAEALLGALFPRLVTVWANNDGALTGIINGMAGDLKSDLWSIMIASGFTYEATLLTDANRKLVITAVGTDKDDVQSAAIAALALRKLDVFAAGDVGDAVDAVVASCTDIVQNWMDARESVLAASRTIAGDFTKDDIVNCSQKVSSARPSDAAEEMIHSAFMAAMQINRSVVEATSTFDYTHTNMRVDPELFRGQKDDGALLPGMPGNPGRMVYTWDSGKDVLDALKDTFSNVGEFTSALAEQGCAMPGELVAPRLTVAADSLFKKFAYMKRLAYSDDITKTLLLGAVPLTGKGLKSCLSNGIVPPVLPLLVNFRQQFYGIPAVVGVPGSMKMLRGIPGVEDVSQKNNGQRNQARYEDGMKAIAGFSRDAGYDGYSEWFNEDRSMYSYTSTPNEDGKDTMRGVIGMRWTNEAGVEQIGAIDSHAVYVDSATTIAVLPLAHITGVSHSNIKVTKEITPADLSEGRGNATAVVFHIGTSCVEDALAPFPLARQAPNTPQPFSGHYSAIELAIPESVAKSGAGIIGTNSYNQVDLQNDTPACMHTSRSLFGPQTIILPASVFPAPMFTPGTGFDAIGGFGEVHKVEGIISHIKPKTNSVPRPVRVTKV